MTENEFNSIEKEDAHEVVAKLYSTKGYKPSDGLDFHIKQFKIQNYKGIIDCHVKGIPPDTQWIFLTGENGFGKTSILQAIAIGLYGTKDEDLVLDRYGIEYLDIEIKDSTTYRINELQGNFTKFENFAAYGPSRLNVTYDRIPKTHNLFNTESKLMNIERYLKEWHGSGELNILYEKFSNILLKVLSPYIVSIKVEIEKETNIKVVKYYESEENQKKGLVFSELSAGCRNLIALVGDMLIRLTLNKKNIDLDNLGGIVLIDEFDNHLHPKWQRMLVEKLTKLFPKVQFIVSTHSPIPFLGAPKNSVFIKVDRTKENGITAEVLDIDVSTLTPNSILTSPVFGFDDINSTEIDIEDVATADRYSNVEQEKRLKEKLNILKLNDEEFFNSLMVK